jgi:hypothetical protein
LKNLALESVRQKKPCFDRSACFFRCSVQGMRTQTSPLLYLCHLHLASPGGRGGGLEKEWRGKAATNSITGPYLNVVVRKRGAPSHHTLVASSAAPAFTSRHTTCSRLYFEALYDARKNWRVFTPCYLLIAQWRLVHVQVRVQSPLCTLYRAHLSHTKPYFDVSRFQSLATSSGDGSGQQARPLHSLLEYNNPLVLLCFMGASR